LWAALDDYRAERNRAVQWLLRSAGETWPCDRTGVISHDTRIPGWPWVEGTHAWLEPTALAVLALESQHVAGHARVRDGIRVICDRAIPTGAWNYGSGEIFGKPLRPQPAPTGIALLALAAGESREGLVDDGCRYLRAALPRVRAPRSLAWGLMGLEACGQRPAEADAWLAESFARVKQNNPTPLDVAQLLLAASGRAMEVLGVEAFERSRA
jgi:hypothetical protein